MKLLKYDPNKLQGRSNTRVKDLVDLVLLSTTGTLDTTRLRESGQATFRRRGSHDVPSTLPPLAAACRDQFAKMAGECGLTLEMTTHFEQLAQFLTPILA